MSDALSRNFLDVDVETGVDNGRLLAYLAAHGEVLSQRYHDNRVSCTAACRASTWGGSTRPATVVRPHTNGVVVANGNGHRRQLRSSSDAESV